MELTRKIVGSALFLHWLCFFSSQMWEEVCGRYSGPSTQQLFGVYIMFFSHNSDLLVDLICHVRCHGCYGNSYLWEWYYSFDHYQWNSVMVVMRVHVHGNDIINWWLSVSNPSWLLWEFIYMGTILFIAYSLDDYQWVIHGNNIIYCLFTWWLSVKICHGCYGGLYSWEQYYSLMIISE